MSAQISRHRDLEPGRRSYAMPQSTTVATRMFKRVGGKYVRTTGNEMPEPVDLPGVKFVAGQTKFTLHPGDGSVYMMTGSANAHFTHQVTCTPSKSGDWLRVSVPTFLFW